MKALEIPDSLQGESFAMIEGTMYAVSNYGRIYSFKSSKFLRTFESAKGYHRCDLYGVGKVYVHRLVYEYHSGQKMIPGFHVDHLDGNKENNHISNLDQCHPRVNDRRARELGLYAKAEERTHKLSPEEVACILRALAVLKAADVAAVFARSYDSILRIKNGQTYAREIELIKQS